MSHARPYTKIVRFGLSLITNEPECIVSEIVDYHMYGDGDEKPLQFSTVFMTDEEYANLPEFQGW